MSATIQQKIERYDKINEIILNLNDNNILDSIDKIKDIVTKPFLKNNPYSWTEASSKGEYIINQLREKVKSGKLKNGDILDLDEYKLTIEASNGCISRVFRILRFNMGVCKRDMLTGDEVITDSQAIFKEDYSDKILLSNTTLHEKEYYEQRKMKIQHRKSPSGTTLKQMIFG